MTSVDENSPTPPLLSIFIISAAALAYEILLIRLFSIIQWHHFAFMVISIALLGYGASGSFITVFRRRLLENYNGVFVSNILLFGISSIACFIAVQQLPFNTLEILWDSSQWQRLFLSYLLLTLPFFFVANVITLTAMRFHQQIALVYGIDLVGAGVGAISIMGLLQMFSPGVTLQLISVASIAAGIFALKYYDDRLRKITIVALISCISLVYLMPQAWLELRISEYKGLEQTLLIKDASLLMRQTSSISRIDVVQSKGIPFRYAPGMSLQSPVGPPEQLAVFRDGDNMTAIDYVIGKDSLEYYDYMSSALPYHLNNKTKNILILGSATGARILQAQLHSIAKIDAVEPNRQLSQLITDQYADYFGWQNLRDKVTIYTTTPRGFATSKGNYDLVLMGSAAASSGSMAGVNALSTSYDYTVEALQSYLGLLSPDGILSITLWSSNPARANLKLFTTVVKAMKKSGIKHPEQNIAWIRSWNTATLLVKKVPLNSEETGNVRNFSESRGFDLAWLPDIRRNEVNRFQILQTPVYYRAAKSILAVNEPEESVNRFMQLYKYDIRPATDNTPYFNNYFKWSSLDEFLSLPGRAGLSMIGVGYPVLLATLVQALAAALILILLPLLFIRGKAKETQSRTNVLIYFLAVGLAFMFIEIAFIQKFTLILSQPLYAVAVAICAFLIFSGFGSLFVQHRMMIESSYNVSFILRRSVISITLITILYIVVLPLISNLIMALPESARLLSAFVIAAPLAFVMGMPFPLGLAALQNCRPQLLPWAWGVNGCASVLSAILAVLLAINIGFNGVMLCAVVLYYIAWLSRIKCTD